VSGWFTGHGLPRHPGRECRRRSLARSRNTLPTA